MATRNTEATYHPSLGGLDISSDPTVLDPNFLTVADNVEYREGGQRKRRPGFRVYSSDPTAISIPPGSTWTHEAAARPNTVFPAASVFIDDSTVYAFHRYNGAAVDPLQIDLSTNGGRTFPTNNATAYNPVAGDVVTAKYISGLTRFCILMNASTGFAYSDNVFTLPTTSTWTQVTPAGSVGQPIGMDNNASNIVYVGQSGGATVNMAFSTNGGTTFTASTTMPAGGIEPVTNALGYQVLASPSAGIWCFISPASGKIYRSTDSGANWTAAAVKSITAGNVALPAVASILAVTSTRMVAVYKGQVVTSDDAGLTWTDRQNLTTTAPTSIQQAGIAGLCNFGQPSGSPTLGAMSLYLDTFTSVTTAQASWISQDSGTTWTIKSVVGGGSHGTTNVAMTACVARAGRGVCDLWAVGATLRDTWYSLSPIPVPIVSSTSAVRALQDYWKYGASLVPTQQYVAVAGASIFASTGQGSWTALTVSSSFGSDSNRTTNITLAGDYAVISDGVSPPVAYDQSLTSTGLIQPQNVQSNLARTVSLASTNPMVITTTNLFTFTSTLGFVTISSTGDLIMTTTSTLTNASTSPSVIFSSTSAIKATPASTITTTFGLTTTTPITFTPNPTSTMFFQSLVNGWSSAGATTATYTSTNSYSAWPKFTHSSYHLNRLFYQGISTAPSDVGYTAASNIMDSTGSDAGTFPVGTGDGDQAMALSRPFYGSLYVFKGPQFGSIWQLSGNTPATFAMVQVGYGAPILNARALITTPTDIYWLSQYGIHSLQTTVKFGNVEEAFLSLPIQRLWRDRILKRTTLNEAWGFWHPQRNIVGWGVQPEGESSQHWLLCYNYALSDPKPGGKKFWSIWKVAGFSTICGAIMAVTSLDADHTGDPHLYVGGNTGLVYEGDQEDVDADFFDAGTAYQVDIRTPKITRFKTRTAGEIPETQEKSFVGIVTYFAPKGSDAMARMTVTVDRRTQTYDVPFSGGGDTLT